MVGETLDQLEDGIRRLKVEYDIFFNGHRKRPPDDLRMKVEKLAKQLADSSAMSSQERFRYNTLIGRFYIYRDRWRRNLQEREMGQEGAEAVAPAPGGRKVPLEPEHLSVSIADPRADESKVRELYDTLVRLKNRDAQAQPPMPFPQFARYIEKQAREIRTRFGCGSVNFTLSLEKDEIRFTARPAAATKPMDGD